MQRTCAACILERAKGIEPSYPAWKAGVLPLNYARVLGYVITCGGRCQRFLSQQHYRHPVICGIKVVVAAQLVAEGERTAGRLVENRKPLAGDIVPYLPARLLPLQIRAHLQPYLPPFPVEP